MSEHTPQDELEERDDVVDRDAPIKPDGNSVAIDVQVGRLSENAFKIQALSQILSARLDGLKRVIDGGKV